MGEGKCEALGNELLNVGALDVLGLLDLDNAEDLQARQQIKLQQKRQVFNIRGST